MSNKSAYHISAIGSTYYSDEERQTNDYYATEPKALEALLEKETFSKNVWECACGGGHLSEVLAKRGYNVKSTDLYDCGYGESGVDFLTVPDDLNYDGDIITNPPYKYALEFVKKSLNVIGEGHKVAMLLRLQFLESKERRKFFETTPPAKIYVSSSRIRCAKVGDFVNHAKGCIMAFAWFIWKKGYTGDTVVKWFN